VRAPQSPSIEVPPAIEALARATALRDLCISRPARGCGNPSLILASQLRPVADLTQLHSLRLEDLHGLEDSLCKTLTSLSVDEPEPPGGFTRSDPPAPRFRRVARRHALDQPLPRRSTHASPSETLHASSRARKMLRYYILPTGSTPPAGTQP